MSSISRGEPGLLGEIDESTVQGGDYLVIAGTATPHLIHSPSPSPTSLTLASSVGSVSTGTAYTIIRAPRRLPSEDLIQMPSNMVIDNSPVPGSPGYDLLPKHPPMRPH